jgi:hypothetical protein
LIIKGIDTIEYKVKLKSYSKEYSKKMKTFKNTGNNLIRLEGEEFNLTHINKEYYKYKITNRNFHITFMEKSCVFKVKLFSKFLWTNGFENCFYESLDFIKRFLKKSTIDKDEYYLTKLDFCMDSDEISFCYNDKKGFVTKVEDTVNRNKSGHFTGFVIGEKGDISLNIYDKTLEIETHNKPWFKDIWTKKNWNKDKKVWRVEFRLNTIALNSYGIFTVEDFINKEKALWHTLTTKWFRINMSHKNKKNISRNEVKRKWKKVQKSENLETDKFLVRSYEKKGDLDSYTNAIAGYITSYAALRDIKDKNTIIDEIEELLDKHLRSKKISFEQAVEIKIIKNNQK